MSTMRFRRGLIGVLILLLALGVFSIVYSVINPERDIMNYISGSATFVIALLTIVYVYVTSKQLEIMSGQLNEMKVERQVQSQPLPWLYGISFKMDKPRFFYSPPGDSYTGQSRYWVNYKVKNVGTSPAVCVDVSARMEVLGDESMNLESTAENISTMEEKQIFPDDVSEDASFLFSGDSKGAVISALRENDVRKYPIVHCRVLYRNILGGCFVALCDYRIYPKDEDSEQDSVLSNWLSEITAFNIKYKDDLEELKRLRKANREKWDEVFDGVKSRFAESVKGEGIDMESWPIPGSFKVKSISEEDYAIIIGDVHYGTRLGF